MKTLHFSCSFLRMAVTREMKKQNIFVINPCNAIIWLYVLFVSTPLDASSAFVAFQFSDSSWFWNHLHNAHRGWWLATLWDSHCASATSQSRLKRPKFLPLRCIRWLWLERRPCSSSEASWAFSYQLQGCCPSCWRDKVKREFLYWNQSITTHNYSLIMRSE